MEEFEYYQELPILSVAERDSNITGSDNDNHMSETSMTARNSSEIEALEQEHELGIALIQQNATVEDDSEHNGEMKDLELGIPSTSYRRQDDWCPSTYKMSRQVFLLVFRALALAVAFYDAVITVYVINQFELADGSRSYLQITFSHRTVHFFWIVTTVLTLINVAVTLWNIVVESVMDCHIHKELHGFYPPIHWELLALCATEILQTILLLLTVLQGFLLTPYYFTWQQMLLNLMRPITRALSAGHRIRTKIKNTEKFSLILLILSTSMFILQIILTIAFKIICKVCTL